MLSGAICSYAAAAHVYTEARRACKSLGDTKERHALEERLSACDAATQLATRLGGMHYPTLLEHLTVLEQFHSDFPFQLRARVTERLYQECTNRALQADPKVKSADVTAAVQQIVSTFRFWDLEHEETAKNLLECPAMDASEPNFLPLVAQHLVDIEALEGAAEESDDDFTKLKRSLERRNSNESNPDNEETRDGRRRLSSDAEAGQQGFPRPNC